MVVMADSKQPVSGRVSIERLVIVIFIDSLTYSLGIQ